MVEHSAQRYPIYRTCLNAEADYAPSELIHYDEDPMCPQCDRFTVKEVNAPQEFATDSLVSRGFHCQMAVLTIAFQKTTTFQEVHHPPAYPVHQYPQFLESGRLNAVKANLPVSVFGADPVEAKHASLSQRSAEDLQEDTEYEPIDRIVLYIDDLDRCPSEKVVSVLEAVHLMLAFPLFVVVVGVDIRWAGTSLHDYYPRHLDSGLQSDSPEPDRLTKSRGASALDYLEKIFQIPFWLPPMEEEASRNMIAAMVPPTAPVSETGDVEKTPEGESVTPTGVEAEAAVEETEAESRKKEPAEAGGAESLFIAPLEREYMLRLAGAVGKSPRRLKRFVNTSRILKASCDALERERFVLDDGKGGTYRAAMTLLAITTGAPRSAIAILSELNDLDEKAALKEFENQVEIIACKHDKAEIEYAREALQVYRAASRGSDPGVSDMRYWAAPAARFSFRSGRI